MKDQKTAEPVNQGRYFQFKPYRFAPNRFVAPVWPFYSYRPFSHSKALNSSRDVSDLFFARPFTSWLIHSPAGDIHQRGNH